MASAGRTRPVPGDGLLHPLPLIAIAGLIVNDHVLKAAAPGLVTGKLSDICGLAFFPLALVAGWEVAAAAVGRWQGPGIRSLVVAVVATGVVFAAVKAVPAATDAYEHALGFLQWPLRVFAAAASGRPPPGPGPVAAETDPTDLIALPALAAAWLVGRARVRHAGARRLQAT